MATNHSIPTAATFDLPYRRHTRHPDSLNARQEWAVERLIVAYHDTQDEDFYRILEAHRLDLTPARVFEAVESLCDLSRLCFEFELRGEWAHFERTADQYSAALRSFARPDRLTSAP